jgi:hypothetical protein
VTAIFWDHAFGHCRRTSNMLHAHNSIGILRQTQEDEGMYAYDRDRDDHCGDAASMIVVMILANIMMRSVRYGHDVRHDDVMHHDDGNGGDGDDDGGVDDDGMLMRMIRMMMLLIEALTMVMVMQI